MKKNYPILSHPDKTYDWLFLLFAIRRDETATWNVFGGEKTHRLLLGSFSANSNLSHNQCLLLSVRLGDLSTAHRRIYNRKLVLFDENPVITSCNESEVNDSFNIPYVHWPGFLLNWIQLCGVHRSCFWKFWMFVVQWWCFIGQSPLSSSSWWTRKLSLKTSKRFSDKWIVYPKSQKVPSTSTWLIIARRLLFWWAKSIGESSTKNPLRSIYLIATTFQMHVTICGLMEFHGLISGWIRRCGSRLLFIHSGEGETSWFLLSIIMSRQSQLK